MLEPDLRTTFTIAKAKSTMILFHVKHKARFPSHYEECRLCDKNVIFLLCYISIIN